MIAFEWPWALALLPLPVLARRWLPPAPARVEAALRVPSLVDFIDVRTSEAGHGRGRGWWLAALAWLALLLAAARPEWRVH